MTKRVPMIGKRYGRLLVIGETAPQILGSGRSKRRMVAVCDCGKECEVLAENLRNHHTRSCGCLHYENTKTAKHGYARVGRVEPEYRIWSTMIQRCTNPKNSKYKDYGARGISVCRRWQYGQGGKSGFQCFIADMGDRPHPRYSIERKLNDGDYEPNNCTWASALEQQRNTRRSQTVIIDGEQMTVRQACLRLGRKYSTVMRRHQRGVSISEALELTGRQWRVKA